jgi:chromosomal replication initiator protein
VFSITLDRQLTAALARDAAGAGPPLRQYIGDKQNLLVRGAIDSLLQMPPAYNPVVFFGPSGTGKSLLAHGVAGRFRYQNKGSRVLLTTGADFARDYHLALQTDALQDMRHKYRRASLLVIDDLHEIGQKTSAQDELIRTLNSLLKRNRGFVATLRQSPLETADLLPGLASRLSGGLSVPLEPPGDAARRRILRQLATARGAKLTDDLIELIISGVPGTSVKPVTVPQLMAVLNQLERLPDRTGRQPNENQVRSCLISRQADSEPPLKSIAKRVCQHFKVRLTDLRGPARQQRIVRARGLAMLLARRLTSNSLEQIGRYFGNRDHTTVLHACRKTDSVMESDPSIRQAFEELTMQFCSN